MKTGAAVGRIYVAVIGGGEADEASAALARETGRLVAGEEWVLLNGGLGGVMEAASQGAAGADGTVVGLLPGTERSDGNPYLTLALPTGLGHVRNTLLVTMSDAVIAIAGSFGTLSEIAFARIRGKPVVGLAVPEQAGMTAGGEPLFTAVAATPAEAVTRVKEMLTRRKGSAGR
ncbi:MAG: TIGR00725 family protein [Spirochaetales bacterium]|nr:TIGR00725 family protein [Spirochaetales bacterium]